MANDGLENEVVGIEPDATRATAARVHGLTVICGLFNVEFVAANGTFDAIVLSDVLEHLPAPAEMLSLASRALRPGGKIIASIPNVAHWTVRLRLLFGKFDYTDIGIMDATHLRWFTAKTARNLFERSGLQVTFIGVTAGTWMPEYDSRLPWRLVPTAIRVQLIRTLSRRFPTLFGCQHIIEAKHSTN